MTLELKRAELERILRNRQSCPVKPERDFMVELIDTFYVSTSPFLSQQDFTKEFQASYHWMEHCVTYADVSWLETLHEILLNPPESKFCGWLEDFNYDYNAFLEKLVALFPKEADEIFGAGRKGFVTPG